MKLILISLSALLFAVGVQVGIFSPGAFVPQSPQNLGLWAALNEGGSATSVVDYSGNSNTGTWHGTQSCSGSYYTTGDVLTYAGCFDGSTNYVDFGNASNMTSTTALTLSAWVEFPSGSTPSSYPEGEIIARDNNSTGRAYDLSWYSGRIAIEISGSEYSEAFSASAATWYHFCVQGSSVLGGWKIYANGTLLGTYAFVAPPSSTAHTYVGARSYVGVPSYFKGNIEDARVYTATTPTCPTLYAAGPHS